MWEYVLYMLNLFIFGASGIENDPDLVLWSGNHHLLRPGADYLGTALYFSNPSSFF